MKKSDFKFNLPKRLIAQHPVPQRSASRLLVLEQENITHRQFSDLLQFVHPGDLLVFNDTKVIPARIFGHKQTGGKVEVLLERMLNARCCLAHVHASKSPKPGTLLTLEGQIRMQVVRREGNLFVLQNLAKQPLVELLEQYGHMPLPPYIHRAAITTDKTRYQTVYAKHQGAVAAPTAGLHFDTQMMQALAVKGVDSTFVTLHVGAGTFQPVRVENIADHTMHAEWIEVSAAACAKIKASRAQGKRVIAVGTTSVRCLETASRSGTIKPYRGDTNIFIYPGYQFKCVDMLLTNFHLPESTLLMLVSAFAGHANVMRAYQQAIEKSYRFFSYGDAMLLTKAENAI